MANPYLPNWEYIPDGEPRVFGDRIYVYGSHDRKDSIDFCDYKLKVWSAPVSDPTKWVCHGDIFRSRDGHDSPSDVDWTDELLFAPDGGERGGIYNLYAYIVNAKGCVAVADRPEGPFRLLSRYEYDIPNHYDNGTFIDPGVLVDDDGRVYIYCGYQGSYMCELKDNMYEAVPGSYKLDIIPTAEPHRFFEACSPRKINGTNYLNYSPQRGSCLDYATSDSPTGPFTYRGTIIDNGIDFPGGNDHGSVCCINGQWYIFYHRMTNGTIMSRRGCVERIEILPDGTIPQVEMPYLGYEDYDFDGAIGVRGDCDDRWLVRIEEMRQSVRIVRQAIEKMPDGPIDVENPRITPPEKTKVLKNMENLINNFILTPEGPDIPAGEAYSEAENPKGALGFFIISNGGGVPYRVKIRAPSFVSLCAMQELIPGHHISDVPIILGSMDFVLGECDR